MGVLKGFQYFLDFLTLKMKVVTEGGNTDALPEFQAVEEQFMLELTATKTLEDAIAKGHVDQGLAIAVVIGRDPFKGSRQMMQALTAKYAQ